MTTVLKRASDRLFPAGGNKYGTLPALLVVLTAVTGAVDSVSYLGLGHVFVANMTGNVVFLGFSLAGAKGVTVWASLTAIGAFLAGAYAAGRIALRVADTSRLFRRVISIQAVFVAAATGVALGWGSHATPAQVVLIVLLGGGMGMQNAVVRKLAVPDLTTTVLTLTITGIAADAPGLATVRRVISIAAMLVGALCGGALYLNSNAGAALGFALALLAVVAVSAHLERSPV
jgi:uncharacterized membrane protein YoaK (UPF0700 family)